MRDLFEAMGHPYETLVLDEPIDVAAQGYEIMSCDLETGETVWQLIRRIVRKRCTDSYIVSIAGTTTKHLVVSPEHLFWARVSGSEPHWVEAHVLVGNEVELYLGPNSWWRAEVVHSSEQTDILDVEVDGTHCYYSDGVLSHNTMYGDPLVTPGGNAIPFHSSVRLRLSSGAKLLDKDKNQYGIKVIATTLKNKVARPGRKVEFEIHFGRGIVEHEQILDVIRTRCKEGPIVCGDKELQISGDGGWKTLSVASHETGEVYLEKKFTKNDFASVMRDPAYEPIIAELLEGAMVIGPGEATHGESLGEEDSDASSLGEE